MQRGVGLWVVAIHEEVFDVRYYIRLITCVLDVVAPHLLRRQACGSVVLSFFCVSCFSLRERKTRNTFDRAFRSAEGQSVLQMSFKTEQISRTWYET